MPLIRYDLCSAADGAFSAWLNYDSATLLIVNVDYLNTTDQNGSVELYHNNVQVRQEILTPGGGAHDISGQGLHMANQVSRRGTFLGLPAGWTVGSGFPAP